MIFLIQKITSLQNCRSSEKINYYQHWLLFPFFLRMWTYFLGRINLSYLISNKDKLFLFICMQKSNLSLLPLNQHQNFHGLTIIILCERVREKKKVKFVSKFFENLIIKSWDDLQMLISHQTKNNLDEDFHILLGAPINYEKLPTSKK